GEVGAIRYAVTPLNFSAKAMLSVYVDADVVNKDSNYDEKFWEEVYKEASEGKAIVTAQTKKTFFHVTTGMRYHVESEGKKVAFDRINIEQREKFAGNVAQFDMKEGKEVVVCKYAAVLSSENHEKTKLVEACNKLLDEAVAKGFDALFAEHAKVWEHKWEEC